MPFALRLPRLSIRERFRNTAAKILPRVSRSHPKGGGLVHDLDPAFSTIAACQAAWGAYGAALRYRDENGFSDSDGPAQDAVMQAMYAWQDAWNAVLAVQPTTLAGAAELAFFMEVHSREQGDLDSTDNALAAITKALKTMAERPAPKVRLKDCAQGVLAATAKALHLPRHDEDAALLRDIQEWEAGLQKYKEMPETLHTSEEDRAVIEALHSLEEKISRTRAKTTAGLIAKARMARIDSMSSEGVQHELEQALEERTATGHFMGLSIIVDLLENGWSLHEIGSQTDHPDAEILRLVKEYWQKAEPLPAIHDKLKAADAGFTAYLQSISGQADWGAKASQYDKDSGRDALVAEQDAYMDAMATLAGQILSVRAQTVEGVRAQAKVAKNEGGSLWHGKHEDLDWDISSIGRFIDGLVGPSEGGQE